MYQIREAEVFWKELYLDHGPFIVWSQTNEFCSFQGSKSGLDDCVKNQIRHERGVQKISLACYGLEC